MSKSRQIIEALKKSDIIRQIDTIIKRIKIESDPEEFVRKWLDSKDFELEDLKSLLVRYNIRRKRDKKLPDLDNIFNEFIILAEQ